MVYVEVTVKGVKPPLLLLMVGFLLSNVARVRTMSDKKTNAEPMQSGPPTTLCQMGDVRQEESPSESLHEMTIPM